MKYKRRTRKRTYSSSSEDEPLSSILPAKRNKNVVTKNNGEADICDFCDVFIENKLKLLIHTADHLIIPLINLKIHQCSECLFCFTSLNSLQEHITSKHPITNNFNESQKPEIIEINSDVIKKEPILSPPPVEIKTECESVPVQIEKNHGQKLKNRIVFEDDPDDEEYDFSDDILNDLTTDCKVNLEIFDTPFSEITSNTYTNDEYENFFNDNFAQDLNVKDSDETDVNGPEKTIQVNVESKKTQGIEEAKYSASVYYGDLIRPGIFRCKKCQKMFSNRFEMIQHEATHMRFKKLRHVVCNACDWYIAGGGVTLHRHFVTSHPNRVHEKLNLTMCNKCGLKYANYGRHCINYHKMFPCSVCGSDIEPDCIVQHMKEHIHCASQQIGEYGAIPHQNGENSAILHQNTGNGAILHQNTGNSAILHQNTGNGAILNQNTGNSEILHQNGANGAITHQNSPFYNYTGKSEFKFCDVCFMFVNSKRSYVYTVQGSIKSANGQKLACDDCKKLCDNLKFVKRRKRNVPVERIGTYRKQKKPLSNDERLKNIQHRFKLFKK